MRQIIWEALAADSMNLPPFGSGHCIKIYNNLFGVFLSVFFLMQRSLPSYPHKSLKKTFYRLEIEIHNCWWTNNIRIRKYGLWFILLSLIMLNTRSKRKKNFQRSINYLCRISSTLYYHILQWIICDTTSFFLSVRAFAQPNATNLNNTFEISFKYKI